MHDLILFGFFAVVAIAATAIIYRNRQKEKARRNFRIRNVIKDPDFGIDMPGNSRTNNNFDASLQDEHDDINDPVVGEPTFHEKAAAGKRTNPDINATEEANKLTEEDISRAKQFFPNDVISFMIMAKSEKPYAGYELLQALLSAGLRFGKMNIFHRYQQTNNANQTLFSLASAVKPGTFEMPKMGGFTTPALMIFMQVSTQKDPAHAFETMLETAHQLVDDLEGEICDDQRQPLSDEKVAAIRMVIADYESAKANKELFA